MRSGALVMTSIAALGHSSRSRDTATVEHGEVADVLAVVTARIDEDVHRVQLSLPSPATSASQRR